MTEEQQIRDDEFDLQLTIAIEEQMEAERYLFEPPYTLFADDADLLSEPLQEDEMSPEEYDEANEVPITEEELFHITKEQEINEYYNGQDK